MPVSSFEKTFRTAVRIAAQVLDRPNFYNASELSRFSGVSSKSVMKFLKHIHGIFGIYPVYNATRHTISYIDCPEDIAKIIRRLSVVSNAPMPLMWRERMEIVSDQAAPKQIDRDLARRRVADRTEEQRTRYRESAAIRKLNERRAREMAILQNLQPNNGSGQ